MPTLNDQIGTAAGLVYQHLAAKGEASLTQIQRALSDTTSNLVSMAIGWLAREGKVEERIAGKTVRIRLTGR